MKATRCPRSRIDSGIVMTGAMLGFPGEDYTTPQTIKATGGFGDPALAAERIERLKWALDRTIALGLSDLTLHAGFIPEPGDPARASMLETLAQAGELAAAKGITLAFETGQETADLLRLTLDELKSPSLKVNFDPANMLLYDMGDPIRAVEILGPDIRSVHVKDARRPKVRRPVGPGSAPGRRRGRHQAIRAGTQEDRLHRAAHRRARGRRPSRPAARRRPRPRLPAAAWQVIRDDLNRSVARLPVGRAGLLPNVSRLPASDPARNMPMASQPRAGDLTTRNRTDAQLHQCTTELTTWASWRPASVRA